MTETNDISVSFSGSGFLIFAHCGAACALEDLGKNIREVSGSSGGSLISSFLALGFSAAEIRDLAFKTDLSNFITIDPTALFSWGICWGQHLEDWLKTTLGKSTFTDIEMPIKILTTDLAAREIFVFSRQTAPLATLAEACRCSSSVPFIYVPAKYEGMICVDAGLMDNLPLNVLSLTGTQKIALQVQSGSASASVRSLLGFTKQVISAMLASSEDALAAWGRATGTAVIPIDAREFDFLNTGLTLAQKQTLFQRGYDAVTTFYSSTR